MPQSLSKKKPLGGINTDIAAKLLPPSQARYLLNIERSLHTEGGNEGVLTPVPASRLLPVPGVSGEGFTRIGAYESEKTGATFVWLHATSGLHTIYRINRELTTDICYQGADLNFSDDPIHAIRGAYLFVLQGKQYLLWVDGTNWQGFLDVETSIATASFHVPYFQLGEFTQAQYWQLPTRPPMHCIQGEWIAAAADDAHEPNYMVDKTWQFRYKYIYTDARETEWSPISTTYYVERSQGQKDAVGLPRKIQLTFSAGHPQVERIVLAFRNCNGNAYAESDPYDWQQFAIIDKHDSCDANDDFWERGIRPDDDTVQYDAAKNDFIYTYDGAGECAPIAVEETNRTENPCPITSFAMAAIEDSLALFNNVMGYPQIDCDISAKFSVSVDPLGPDTTCSRELATVKVAVLIHNIQRQVNQPVWIKDSNKDGSQKFFGGIYKREGSLIGVTPFTPPGPYGQFFPEHQEGFIVYAEGMQAHAITRQYRLSNHWDFPYTGFVPEFSDWGPETDFDNKGKRRQVSKDLADEVYYVQLATLTVIKGTKGFLRLGGHRSLPTDAFTDTSTTVYGVLRDLNSYGALTEINSQTCDLYAREIYFDTTAGDVDLTTRPFVVADLTAPYADIIEPIEATAACGYLRDKRKNAVPQADILMMGTGRNGEWASRITDHNGFFFGSWAMNWIGLPSSLGFKFYVEGPGCTKVLGNQSVMVPGGGTMPNMVFEKDVQVDRVDGYEDSYFTYVKWQVVDCRGIAMPGIALVLPFHKARYSDTAGGVTVAVRNRAYAYGVPYTVNAVLMQGDTGFSLCGTSCSTIMPSPLVNLPACFSNVEISLGNAVQLNPFEGVSRGLKSGGKYGFQVIFHDGSGRHTWVPDAVKYLTMPTLSAKGKFLLNTLSWALDVSGLPSWIEHLSIARTGNLAYENATQWVADAVRFTDGQGKDTSVSGADKIHLSVHSLVLFADSNLSSTIHYEYVAGDKLQVLTDASGKLYGNVLEFLIEGVQKTKPDPTDAGQTVDTYELIISYDPQLKDLKAGALLELLRPNACVSEQPFFELCDTIDVVNGTPVVTSGVLDTFDTYQVRRSIGWDAQQHLFAFPFEHNGPSDFWGGHCDDRGRVFFKNRWAKQMHLGRHVAISDLLYENGNRNGLSTFHESRMKTFKGEKKGDITRAVSFGSAVKLFYERANTTAVVGDDIIRTGRDGIARVASADDLLVEPNQAPSIYGLQYEDVQAFTTGKGWLMWVDSEKKAIVLDGGERPEDVTQGRFQSHFTKKLVHRSTYNADKSGFERIRMVMGYDPTNESAYLTFWGQGFSDGYTANRAGFKVDGNETIGIAVQDQAIFPYSFTPEGYGTMGNSENGAVFFSFKNGLPWVHKEPGTTLYNQFFGVACDQRLVVLINEQPDWMKLFIAMQVQSMTKYYCDSVTTQMSDSRTGATFAMQSEIPPGTMALRENKWNGAFLFNKLTPGVAVPLYQGEALRGYYAEVSLVRDNTLNDSLQATDDSKRTAYSELDNLFFTYAKSEQSSFGANS